MGRGFLVHTGWAGLGRHARRAALLLLGMALCPRPAQACTVPVFRYAMQMWRADPYTLVVFHAGDGRVAAPAVVESWVRELAPRVNLRVRGADTVGRLAQDLRRVWARQGQVPTPWGVLCNPAGGEVWSGPCRSRAVLAHLLFSPARRELGERLLEGQAAVWLFLESGHPRADAAAARVLEQEVARFTARGHPDSVVAAGLWAGARFSTLRVARSDPAESVLVAMLLRTEPDLESLDQPMAFPVFGRGRVLYALVGRGISVPNIREACAFLAGACSCQAKELNPGSDLMLAVDWDQRLADAAEDSIPLTGGLAEAGRGGAKSGEEERRGSGIVGFLWRTPLGRRLTAGVGTALAGIVLAALWLLRRPGG